MLDTLKRTGAFALLAAAAAVLPAACARNDSSIFVRGCAVRPRDTCSVTASLTTSLQFGAFIDAAYAQEYSCFALVENQIVPRGDPNKLRTETSGVQLYQAEVALLDAGLNAIPVGCLPGSPNCVCAGNACSAPAGFSIPITGFVDPGTGGMPGLGLSAVTLLDSGTMHVLAAAVQKSHTVQQVVAAAILHGRTLGGLEVHTQEFLYPINVTSGSTCTEPSGMKCVGGMGGSMMGDCLLGQDANPTCENIAAQLGVCGLLECTTPGDPTTAHCPAHSPADISCCCVAAAQPCFANTQCCSQVCTLAGTCQ
jgi:hypothetical protein